MGKVRIVTDSTADIPDEVRERLGINMVPLKVHFGEETFLDAVTINSEQFYEKLAQVFCASNDVAAVSDRVLRCIPAVAR